MCQYLRFLLISSQYRASADMFSGARRDWRISRADHFLSMAQNL